MIPGRFGTARVVKDLTLSGGAGVHEDNLFLVQGPVHIHCLWGAIEEQLANLLSNARFDLYDGSATDLTTGSAISNLPPKSWIGKTVVATKALKVLNASSASFHEPILDVTVPSAGVMAMKTFVVVPNTSVDTYIRFVHGSVGVTSGKIRFVCEYRTMNSLGISPA